MSVSIAILVITVIFRLPVSGSQSVPRGRQFSRMKEPCGSDISVTDNPLQTFVRTRGVISCAALCSRQPSCNSFSYNTIEEVCHISDINRSQYSVDDKWHYYQVRFCNQFIECYMKLVD